MMAWVIVKVSYRSQRVSNLYSSRSTATENCLIPSRVSCSFLTRILTGSRMNLDVMFKISIGMVAENKQTCTFATPYHPLYQICLSNPHCQGQRNKHNKETIPSSSFHSVAVKFHILKNILSSRKQVSRYQTKS